MLKFFRRIRQKLLVEGNLRKYSVYAIGEILLVVIGILIALQINSWNQQVQDRGQEKEYLASIKEDLMLDTTNLNLSLMEVNKHLDATITLIKFFNQPQRDSYDTAKIYNSIISAGFLYVFETNAPTFDDLRSTGNLRVILNMELKKAISSYYTLIESNKEALHFWREKRREYWLARDEFINGRLNAWWLNGFSRGIVPIALPENFNVSKEDAKNFLQTLYNNLDMKNFQRTIYSNIKTGAIELIDKIDNELANK